jgi:hypothetical protein
MDRRIKRSEDRQEALQYLVEALADRSDVDAVVLLDGAGRIVAGVGTPHNVRSLADITVPVVEGQACARFEEATEGTDFFGRRVAATAGALYLSLLGTRVRKMHEAVNAITRIVQSASAG